MSEYSVKPWSRTIHRIRYKPGYRFDAIATSRHDLVALQLHLQVKDVSTFGGRPRIFCRSPFLSRFSAGNWTRCERIK